MPFSGGVFSRLYSWVADAASGIPITASRFDADENDIASALTTLYGMASYQASGTGSVARTIQSKLRETVSPEDFGAVGDGVADDSTAMANAMAALSGAGGILRCKNGSTYKISSSLVLLSGITPQLNGATISWAGGAAAVITSLTSSILSNAGIEGGVIDGGTTAAQVVQMFSPYHCRVKDVSLKSNSATCVALDLGVNTTGGANADGNRNAAFNVFENVLQDGACGQALRMTGDAAVPTVVTLNTFINFCGRGASVYGINFVSWADSNYFAGVTRLQITANNGVGVIWNSGTPASNVGVYSNNFDHLAVDTFGALTGRVGIVMNWTKLNKLDYYFNDPPAEGGAYTFSANCQSYDVYHQVGLTSNTVRRQKLAYDGGVDNPFMLVGYGPEISTQTVGVEVGLGRTGNGFAYVDLIGDTTYPAFGLRMIRNNGGANTSSALVHRGTGNMAIQCSDAGSQIILQNSGGVRLVTNDTGIGFNGNAAVAQSTGWGTPTGNVKLSNFPGATATLAQTSAQVAQLIIDLKSVGLLGA